MTHYIQLLTRHTLEQLKEDALNLELAWPKDAAQVYTMIAERSTGLRDKTYYLGLAGYMDLIAAHGDSIERQATI